jgi:hypothetical protein
MSFRDIDIDCELVAGRSQRNVLLDSARVRVGAEIQRGRGILDQEGQVMAG